MPLEGIQIPKRDNTILKRALKMVSNLQTVETHYVGVEVTRKVTRQSTMAKINLETHEILKEYRIAIQGKTVSLIQWFLTQISPSINNQPTKIHWRSHVFKRVTLSNRQMVFPKHQIVLEIRDHSSILNLQQMQVINRCPSIFHSVWWSNRDQIKLQI